MDWKVDIPVLHRDTMTFFNGRAAEEHFPRHISVARVEHEAVSYSRAKSFEWVKSLTYVENGAERRRVRVRSGCGTINFSLCYADNSGPSINPTIL